MTTATLQFGEGAPLKSATVHTQLFINGEFVDSVDGETLEVVNPSTGKPICTVSAATARDVDIAVKAARKAYNTSWGFKVSGINRGVMLNKLADQLEQHADEVAAIEALDNGKAFSFAKGADVNFAIQTLRYYAGWAGKSFGKVLEVDDSKFAYTRHEPIGVVGQIIPWNFPLLMMAWKIAPALATGNAVVLKTAGQTPLSALKLCEWMKDIFPPGVINVITDYGAAVGSAISAHMDIDKVAFTGSTLVGRAVMKAAANSNLKKVTLELGGKSPNIIFDDADLEQAAHWSAFGLFFNHGQCCAAGSRVYVQESIYDKFMETFTAVVKAMKVGDPFKADTFQGPQVSQLQFDRIMKHIEAGKKSGATVLTGGERHGTEGYFIQPTIFTDVAHDASIAREEIFGPVVVVTKFKDEDDVVQRANDTTYGLAAAIFSQNITRATQVSNRLLAGTVWINCYNSFSMEVPFGGFKESGIGRELGPYALENYTEIKAVHVNLSAPCPI